MDVFIQFALAASQMAMDDAALTVSDDVAAVLWDKQPVMAPLGLTMKKTEVKQTMKEQYLR